MYEYNLYYEMYEKKEFFIQLNLSQIIESNMKYFFCNLELIVCLHHIIAVNIS